MTSSCGGEEYCGGPGHDHDHQYPEAIQLKLYQAFIFSIPILFSIILILLFYLFYLKRRTPLAITDAAADDNKLFQILFHHHSSMDHSMCSVCLGEFEDEEEVVEVGGCKHMFHLHCIRNWLPNNSSCPLCRAPI